MNDLLHSLGLNPLANYRGQGRRLPFIPATESGRQKPLLDSDNPFAPAVNALDEMVETYRTQRQESAMLDAMADALAVELGRYAEKGQLPSDFTKRFTNFNAQPLERKRGLVAQGMFLLDLNQQREQQQMEQGRRNAEAFVNMLTRGTGAVDRFLSNRAREAQDRREYEDQQQQNRVIADILAQAGVSLPESAKGGLSAEAARVAITAAGNRAARDEVMDEASAKARADELNRQLKGTRRRAIAVPVGANRWKVQVIAEGAGEREIDPNQFDVNKNQVLDPEEYMQYQTATVMGRMTGGVYPGMPLAQPGPDAIEPDEETIQKLLDAIDPNKLKRIKGK